MRTEDKELLLKDLSARLPYGVICNDNRHGSSRVTNIDITPDDIEHKNPKVVLYDFDFDECGELKNCKPYLRPMSSMTEEEKDEMFGICTLSDCSANSSWESVGVEIMSSHPRYGDHYSTDYTVIDWLNKNMFDYRGLIEKGLAIEVTEENNPYKK